MKVQRVVLVVIVFGCLVNWSRGVTVSAPFMLTGGFHANGTYSNSFVGQNYFAGSTATGPIPRASRMNVLPVSGGVRTGAYSCPLKSRV